MPRKAQQPLLTDWVKSKVTEAQKKKLRSLAKKSKQSESLIVRSAIALYLKHEKTKAA